MDILLKDLAERFPEFKIKNYNESAYFVGFSHDSRTIKENELFIPIIGERFDGHNYIFEAFEDGASMAICLEGKYDTDWDGLNMPIIIVKSIEDGLQKILNYAISHITAPVVAITGSTGKTTTKQMLTSILKTQMKVLHGDKSNTVWGNAVILSQYDDHDVIVLECAMDRKGEIAWHVNAVDPDLGILLNIGYVHAENVGTIEDVYKEKKDLADYMERTGKPLVLNIDDERLVRIYENYREGAELISFGQREDADFVISDIKIDKSGTRFKFRYYDNTLSVNLKIFGEGYAYNAMAAIVAANRLGVSIENCIKGVEQVENNNGRFEKLEFGDRITIINDAYNANPTSMNMALKTFDLVCPSIDYHRIVVLGDMKELGEVSSEEHRKLGEMVKDYNFEEVYYVGDMYTDFNFGEHLESSDEVAAMLNIKIEMIKEKNIAILLKSSNSIGLYQVPDFLKKLGII